MEKNLKKCVCVCVYIYVYLYHSAVHWKLTQHCKSALFQLNKYVHKYGLRELPHHAVLKVKVWLPSCYNGRFE